MKFRIVAVAALMGLLGGPPARAHEVFRFVGTLTKVDLKGPSIDMRSLEDYNGQTAEYPRHLALRQDCKVTRNKKELPRTDLKVGAFVVVDAVGVDINDLEATEIALKPAPAPKGQ